MDIYPPRESNSTPIILCAETLFQDLFYFWSLLQLNHQLHSSLQRTHSNQNLTHTKPHSIIPQQLSFSAKHFQIKINSTSFTSSSTKLRQASKSHCKTIHCRSHANVTIHYITSGESGFLNLTHHQRDNLHPPNS